MEFSNVELKVLEGENSKRNPQVYDANIVLQMSINLIKNVIPTLNMEILKLKIHHTHQEGPSIVSTEIVDYIQDLILVDCQIAAKRITETLEISKECIGFIIHEELCMHNLSAKWAPKCLNDKQK